MNYYNKKTSMENQIKPEAYLKAIHSKSAGFPIEAKKILFSYNGDDGIRTHVPLLAT